VSNDRLERIAVALEGLLALATALLEQSQALTTQPSKTLCVCMHERNRHSHNVDDCTANACDCLIYRPMTPKITPARLAELEKEGSFQR
jgi:hypothetical protein